MKPLGSLVVPEVNAMSASASPASSADGPSIGSASSSGAKGAAPGGKSPMPGYHRRPATPKVARQQWFVRLEVLEATEPIGGDHDLRMRRSDDVGELLGSEEVDDRYHHGPMNNVPQNTMPASTQFGSCNMTTSPRPMPRSRSAEANERRPDRCRRSCCATGARAEWTTKLRPPFVARLAATVWPIDSSGPPSFGDVALGEFARHGPQGHGCIRMSSARAPQETAPGRVDSVAVVLQPASTIDTSGQMAKE